MEMHNCIGALTLGMGMLACTERQSLISTFINRQYHMPLSPNNRNGEPHSTAGSHEGLSVRKSLLNRSDGRYMSCMVRSVYWVREKL